MILIIFILNYIEVDDVWFHRHERANSSPPIAPMLIYYINVWFHRHERAKLISSKSIFSILKILYEHIMEIHFIDTNRPRWHRTWEGTNLYTRCTQSCLPQILKSQCMVTLSSSTTRPQTFQNLCLPHWTFTTYYILHEHILYITYCM